MNPILRPLIRRHLPRPNNVKPRTQGPISSVSSRIRTISIIRRTRIRQYHHNSLLLMTTRIRITISITKMHRSVSRPQMTIMVRSSKFINNRRHIMLQVTRPIQIFKIQRRSRRVRSISRSRTRFQRILTRSHHDHRSLGHQRVPNAYRRGVKLDTTVKTNPLRRPSPTNTIRPNLLDVRRIRGKLLTNRRRIRMITTTGAIVRHQRRHINIQQRMRPSSIKLLIRSIISRTKILIKRPIIVLTPRIQNR